ncbi:MAG: hypothetical protein ACRCZK_01655 [Oscillospiraceae bacterium]
MAKKITKEKLQSDVSSVYRTQLKTMKELQKAIKDALESDELFIISPANGKLVNPIIKAYNEMTPKYQATVKLLLNEFKAKGNNGVEEMDIGNFSDFMNDDEEDEF